LASCHNFVRGRKNRYRRKPEPFISLEVGFLARADVKRTKPPRGDFKLPRISSKTGSFAKAVDLAAGVADQEWLQAIKSAAKR
jgi:hypothetical protein